MIVTSQFYKSVLWNRVGILNEQKLLQRAPLVQVKDHPPFQFLSSMKYLDTKVIFILYFYFYFYFILYFYLYFIFILFLYYFILFLFYFYFYFYFSFYFFGKKVSIGSMVIISNQKFGKYLHSENLNYKEGSSQQIVTLVEKASKNETWIFRAIDFSEKKSVNIVDGLRVRLEHVSTNKFLHSQPNVKSPFNQNHQEVSCFTEHSGNIWYFLFLFFIFIFIFKFFKFFFFKFFLFVLF